MVLLVLCYLEDLVYPEVLELLLVLADLQVLFHQQVQKVRQVLQALEDPWLQAVLQDPGVPGYQETRPDPCSLQPPQTLGHL